MASTTISTIRNAGAAGTRWQLPRGGKAGLALLLLLAAVVLPSSLPPYLLNVAILALIFGIAAVGLDLLMGYTGLDSLGQAAFYGTAAYVVGILTVSNGMNWYLAAGIALLTATVLGMAVGFVAVRLEGLYFLLITLAFGQVLWGAVQRWGGLTGGFNGLSGVPMPFDALTNPVNFCYLASALFALVLAAARLIVSSPFGLGLRGCRDDETRLQTLGFRSFVLKWLAFVMAAFFAALAGVLAASFNSFVSPSDTSLQLSFAMMLMVIIGGAGYIYGAVAGAVIVTALQYELSVYVEDYWLLLLGVLYGITAVFLPNGFLGSRRSRRSSVPTTSEHGAATAQEPTPGGEPDFAHAAPRQPRDLPDAEPVLVLRDLTRTFGGFTALDGVSLTFTAGERTAIIGPNGAGKTTLFNVISGLHAPSSGTIVMGEHDLTGAPLHRRPAIGLGRTFQITRVFAPLTVLENMTLALLGCTHQRHQYTMWRRTARVGDLHEQAMAELERVGLAEFAAEQARSLSYGHQKQLDIALALASRPRLLLLDEPTAGLSQTEAYRMMGLVDALPSDITVLIIEHNLDIVFRLTDRLVVLDHGKVLVDGPRDVVRRSDEVRRIYFGTRG